MKAQATHPAPPSADQDLDPDTIRRALAVADPNVLRLAMYHLTRDPRLAAMSTQKVLIWAGALFTYALAPEHHDEVRQLAFDVLTHKVPTPGLDRPMTRVEVRQTMEFFGHGPLTDKEFEFAYEEAAFDDVPRAVEWHARPSADELSKVHVLVVGAGISGIAAAVELERLGIPYTVIERQDDVGGTWHLNRYPECRVDSTSMIYQYKFEKKYPWSEFFATGGETKRYLRHCAEKHGILKNVRFNLEARRAHWDESKGHWRVTLQTADGREEQLVANFIISATGLFSTPKLPNIPGIERFGGKVMMSAKWDPSYDLRGKHVVQVGTGATGVQLAPHIARIAASLTVFQRTPNWVLPMEGYKANLPDGLSWLFEHVPYYWNWFCYSMYYLNAQLEGLQVLDEGWHARSGGINQRNDELRNAAESYVHEKFASRPDLIEKMLPNYPPMARRPTIDNNWYDTVLRDNVTVVTSGIREITQNAVIANDGTAYECDTLVSAAGFATTDYFMPLQFVGRDGLTPEQLWSKDGPRAYLGLTLPGFPNLFTPFGPNSQGRSGSFYSVAEMWARYSLKAIVHVIESGKTSIECRESAYVRYNEALAQESKKLLWERYGKGFYYLTKEGRSVVNSPWSGPEYHDLLLHPKFEDFLVQ